MRERLDGEISAAITRYRDAQQAADDYRATLREEER